MDGKPSSKNISQNPERTKYVLSYLYRIAKIQNKLDGILDKGKFSENAVRIAARKGAVSLNMVQSFADVMHIDPLVITGDREFTEDIMSNCTIDGINDKKELNEDELLNAISSLMQTKNEQILDKIRLLLKVNQ